MRLPTLSSVNAPDYIRLRNSGYSGSATSAVLVRAPIAVLYLLCDVLSHYQRDDHADVDGSRRGLKNGETLREYGYW